MFASPQKGSVLILTPVDVIGPSRAKFRTPKVEKIPKGPERKVPPPAKRAAPRLQVQPPPVSAVKLKRSPSSSPYAQPNSPIASCRKPQTPIGGAVKTPRDEKKESFSYDQKKESFGYDQKIAIVQFSPPPPPPSPRTPVSEPVPSLLPQPAKPAETPAKNKTMFSPTYSEPEPSPEIPMEEEFDPWLFIKNLPPLSAVQRENRNRRVFLPKKLKHVPEVCLALDLDETLVHCSVQPIPNPDLTFTVSFNDVDYQVYVRQRPYLLDFLKVVSQWFEIVVFTASQRVYADKLLSMLDPSGRYIAHRMFRDSCLCVDGNYLKDLSVLGRDIRKVAIIDNSLQAFGYQLNNGIPIESWFDDDDDQELLKLLPFLNKLKDCVDVRSLIRDTFRLEEHLRARFALQ